MDNSKVLEKIRKLIALSHSPNEAEAASAAAKAQEILAAHNLSMSDVEKTNSSQDDHVSTDSNYHTEQAPWRRPLAQAVARLYFCEYFYTVRDFAGPKGSIQTRLVHTFVGKKHNVEVARLMYQYIGDAIFRMAQEGSKSVPAPERSPYRVSFKAAATQRLRLRIREIIEQTQKASPLVAIAGKGNVPALLNLYQEEAEQNAAFMQSLNLRTGVPTRLNTNLHGKGQLDGDKAGRSINLQGQVQGSRSTAALPKH